MKDNTEEVINCQYIKKINKMKSLEHPRAQNKSEIDDQKESLLILHNIDTTINTQDDILTIFESLSKCPIINQYCNIVKQQRKSISIYYESIRKKQNEIENLQKQIDQLKSNNSVVYIPIFKACKEGDLTSVKYFIEKQCFDPQIKTNLFDFELQLSFGDSPIHTASIYGHLPIIEYLIAKQNVNIDTRGFNQMTPLHYACEGGHIPIIQYLISIGANINAKDSNGDYVIHYASKNGLLSIIQYLIEEQNIDINIKGQFERTPIHYACSNGHFPIVQYLISRGADINSKDSNGDYLIHYASEGGLLPIVMFLIEKHGIDKDITGYEKDTPLHNACRGGHLSIVKYLISKHADIEAKDKYARTPLFLASIYGTIDIVQYLLSNGADKHAADIEGSLPYQVADNPKIRAILI